jgi:hypothetical protein
MSREQAIRGLQFLLQSTGFDVLVDGMFGPKTLAALKSAPEWIREAAQRSPLNWTPDSADGNDEHEVEHPASFLGQVPHWSDLRESVSSHCVGVYLPGGVRADVVGAINLASITSGVPLDTLMKVARVESRLDPDAISATGARGLFQITDIAFEDIRASLSADVVSEFEANPLDPWVNATVGAQYWRRCIQLAKSIGVDPTIANVYAVYNIGVGAVQRLHKGQFDDPVVRRVVSAQSAALAADGPSGYLRNVQTLFA